MATPLDMSKLTASHKLINKKKIKKKRKMAVRCWDRDLLLIMISKDFGTFKFKGYLKWRGKEERKDAIAWTSQWKAMTKLYLKNYF